MRLKLILSLAILFYGCAHIVPPDGGTKDTTPPKLTKSTPINGSVNVTPERILLAFSENIEVDNINNNMRITPDLNTLPKTQIRKNKIIITLNKDSLQPKTTYTIDFGKAITDITEKNAITFQHKFSTGPQIDSAFLQGKTFEIKEKKTISNSLIKITNLELKTNYTILSSEKGEWNLPNIPIGIYQVTAFKDKNGNKTLDNGELYFYGKFNTDSLYRFHNLPFIPFQSQEKKKIKVNTVKYIDDYTIAVTFNHQISNVNHINYSISNTFNKKNPSFIQTEKKDSFIILHPFTTIDSINLNIQSDTSQIFLIKQPKNRKQTSFIIKPRTSLIREGDPIYFTSNTPFFLTNSERIKINGLSNNFTLNKLTPYTFSITTKTIGTKQIEFRTAALTDINGRENTEDTITIYSAEQEQTGNYEFTIKDTVNNYQGSIVVKIFDQINSYTLNTSLNKLNRLTGLLPGTYTLECWFDSNSNQEWDTGNYFIEQKPETIRLLENFITIKPNWDSVGVDIYLD